MVDVAGQFLWGRVVSVEGALKAGENMCTFGIDAFRPEHCCDLTLAWQAEREGR